MLLLCLNGQPELQIAFVYWIDCSRFLKKTEIIFWGRDRALGFRLETLGFRL